MSDDSNPTRAARSTWAWVPVMLLSGMFLGLGTMAYLAIHDPHFALEPDYYDKAVHWDRSRAAAQASAASGLGLSLARPLATAADGSVEVEIRVVDRDKRLVSGARVELQAFPNAYAAQVQTSVLRESTPGVYVGRLEHGVLGLWELRFALTRDEVRFQEVLRQDVVKGGAV